MDFRNRLQGLDHAAMVETVYLCGRYLSHGLTPASFQRQLDVDVKTRHRDQSAAAVLDIMSAIEAEERAPIADLAAGVRSAYADKLGECLWDDSEPDADAEAVERALASMSSH